MGATLAYCRVSTSEQSTEAQRHTIGARYEIKDDHWFEDEAVSGSMKALQRPGFASLFKFARKGDTVIVAAIDRLGRDTVDVLETVEALKGKGVGGGVHARELRPWNADWQVHADDACRRC